MLLAALALFAQGCASDGSMYGSEEDIDLLSGEEGDPNLDPEMKSAEERAARRARLKSAEVYRESGIRLGELGDHDNAIANFRKALELYPDHHAARFELAEMLALDESAQREAVAMLKDLLHRMRHNTRGREEEKIRESAESLLLGLDEMGMALTEAAAVLTAYGIRAERASRLENALELYAKALKLWPACSEARVRTRDLCEKLGWELPDLLREETKQEVFLDLTELSPKSVEIKNGTLLRNKTKWGMPFYNRGSVFTCGLWTPAPSQVTFDLDGRYARLTAKVLISAFAGPEQQVATLEKELGKPRSGTVNFKVHGDGRLLFESGVVTYGVDPHEFTVDVSGIDELVLECDPADGSDLLDFSVWADGKLYLK